MFKWTIIGRGIQAVTIALKLRTQGLATNDLCIIDPHTSLCEQFNRYTSTIDMPYLRSPCVHHVHPDPFHLKQFAKHRQYTNASYGRYQRPNREMFMAHTHMLIHELNLNHSHVQASATSITKQDNLWFVQCNNSEAFSTENLIIAFGCNHQINFPKAYKNQPDVTHIFDGSYKSYSQSSHVIGSGISAAHLTLKLIKHNPQQIHLWTNKPLAVHDFDADPGWLGPKYMTRFKQITTSEEKQQVILNERHKGSMPKELELRLKKYVKQGKLVIHTNELQAISNHQIITEHKAITYDHIILATGFEETIMKQPIIKQLIHQHHAPLCSCGFPNISSELEWLPHLYVAGGLADLELGPFARNIMGGREAATRISNAFSKETTVSSI
ncbi:lysine N(6)-hydroxylase/L-ornithine N(5)-oxygenase family protein [Staphylococcus gallinarum]|uniref:NAD(P)-binding domain-containing protein n=1 Tax=Staphylococcus gallinarum TaxID=1293 RepID=UPI002DB79330|nr:NAD(P)-binding domain-containing protein [Staphylococcus gallinarum]MEB6237640.1 lysine N(6)-hydroxylase/L-ornithine N(5)-oxygenase family protein [Staphylococcus gallinarum]